MQITCATYNILHGYHRDLILKNLRFLIDEGTDVICLQEAEVRFEAALAEFLRDPALTDWKITYAHLGLGGNVAILWNTTRLTLESTSIIPLPKLEVPTRLERLKGLADSVNRVALAGLFTCHDKTVQITSTHVAWEGGLRHRLRQVRHLREKITEEEADYRIVAGDFNTIGVRSFRKLHHGRVHGALGHEYINAHPDVRWTYDNSYIDPDDGVEFMKALHKTGITFRRRLDYIFARDMHVLAATMHDLPGSDHRPLVATFSSTPAKHASTGSGKRVK